jgi:hypothetical protein
MINNFAAHAFSDMLAKIVTLIIIKIMLHRKISASKIGQVSGLQWKIIYHWNQPIFK